MNEKQEKALFETRDLARDSQKDIGYIKDELEAQKTKDEEHDLRLGTIERKMDVLTLGVGGIYTGALIFIRQIATHLGRLLFG